MQLRNPWKEGRTREIEWGSERGKEVLLFLPPLGFLLNFEGKGVEVAEGVGEEQTRKGSV